MSAIQRRHALNGAIGSVVDAARGNILTPGSAPAVPISLSRIIGECLERSGNESNEVTCGCAACASIGPVNLARAATALAGNGRGRNQPALFQHGEVLADGVGVGFEGFGKLNNGHRPCHLRQACQGVAAADGSTELPG